ncbi:MAG TPA: c-type cytochrome domain-containing protein [Chitinophagaceae bacterium]|jgi:mono/diheme cytochrome c family protein|nr:c-type cytochrome domain-containing protein [Chitinophagaceae bacterium]
MELLSLTQLIGRFHPLIVHLPIGILLLALLLQWLSRKEQYALAPGALKVIWGLGILSALLACITGFLLSGEGGYEEGTVGLHMWMGIGTTAVALLVAAKVFSRRLDTGFKVACGVLVLLIAATGHFGGSLTHGEDYLTAALQDPKEEGPAAIRPIANVQEAKLYADIVHPILETRCISCHGPEKQKGKLRLDSPEALLKGGKGGPAIVAGNPDGSELLKRILLPEEDEDHMPPKKKPQLTEKQVALLHWWIEKGAPFDLPVRQVEQPEKVKPLLASLQEEAPRKPDDFWPQGAVPAADAAAMQALRAKGVLVMPIAKGSNYLTVNFINASQVTQKELALLPALAQQLVELKLNNVPVGDEALPFIGQCHRLRMLQLRGTKVTDKGLPALNALIELKSLHLVGTAVTARGLLQLTGLKSLRALYLYRTGAGRQDWSGIKARFPNALIDTGGYAVPTLPGDTTVLKSAVQ